MENGKFTLQECDVIKLILVGDSVIDFKRLNFTRDEEISNFLRINGYFAADPNDLERIENVKQKSLKYLLDNFPFTFEEEIKKANIFSLLKHASNWKIPNKKQANACIILKVMNIINHLEGRELLFNLPVSSSDLVRIVSEYITNELTKLKNANIVNFHGGEKTKDSLITKLMSKRETIAAQIFDKIRFRIIVKEKTDVLNLIRIMTKTFLPFNYIIPGESINNLVKFESFVKQEYKLKPIYKYLQIKEPHKFSLWPMKTKNEFSSKKFKSTSFVFDLPIRLDKYYCDIRTNSQTNLGKIVFSLIEFQIFDHETALLNETGEARHESYKTRQKSRVKERLERCGV
jgi:uncharacterized protein (TIGR04552 family)